MASRFLLHLALYVSTTLLSAYASDPSMLQDFCVAANDPNSEVFVNGFLCKNPNEVTADDFVYRGLNSSKFEFNDDRLGFRGTPLTGSNFPGINTMGVSIGRLEFDIDGLSPPHILPASSMILVLKGTLHVGFVSGVNKLYSKVLNEGDVFVIPQGLVHFKANIGKTKADALVAFASQNPGQGLLADKIFGTDPPISADVLSKAFQLDTHIVEDLQSKFKYNNN